MGKKIKGIDDFVLNLEKEIKQQPQEQTSHSTKTQKEDYNPSLDNQLTALKFLKKLEEDYNFKDKRDNLINLLDTYIKNEIVYHVPHIFIILSFHPDRYEPILNFFTNEETISKFRNTNFDYFNFYIDINKKIDHFNKTTPPKPDLFIEEYLSGIDITNYETSSVVETEKRNSILSSNNSLDDFHMNFFEKKQAEMYKKIKYSIVAKPRAPYRSVGDKGYREARKIIGQAIVDALRE